MRAMLAAVVAILCLAASPAWAWWEYAKWGMTPAQLVAASKGAVQLCNGAEEKCRQPLRDFQPKYYQPDLIIAGMPAHAQFAFNKQDKLVATVIWFQKDLGNFARLTSALDSIYGPPATHDLQSPENYTWRDGKKGSNVRLWKFDGGDVRVEYRPKVCEAC